MKRKLLLAIVAIMTFTTITLPINSHINTASANTVTVDDGITIIKQTTSEMVYEIEDNGEILLYEEFITESDTKTTISTNVYKTVDGEKQLVDQKNTEIITNNNSLEVINEKNHFFIDTNIIANSNQQVSSPGFSTFAYSSWVDSRMPGINLGYRRDLAANKGDAKYGTKSKVGVSLNNSHFDDFKSKVDTLRAREVSALLEAGVVGAIKEVISAGLDGLSLSTIGTILRKMALPVDIIYNASLWLWNYNAAINHFSDIPGPTTDICNWSC